MKINVNTIIIGDRIRKDMGDMERLVNSIRKYGLIEPIVINKDKKLLAGARRLEAVKRLGWREVEVRVIETKSELDQLNLEMEENLIRKQFTQDEYNFAISRREFLLHPSLYVRIKKFFLNLIKWILRIFQRK